MVLSRLGRKTMTLMGFLSVTFSHFMISYWVTQRDGQLVLAFMIMLQVSLQVLVSPVIWMYLSETLNDTQFGTIATLHYSTGAVVSVTVEFLSKALKPEGLFTLLGVIALASTFFLATFFKETANLADKEKKELYVKKDERRIKEIQMSEIQAVQLPSEVDVQNTTEAKSVDDAEKYQKVDSSADSVRSSRVEVIIEE